MKMFYTWITRQPSIRETAFKNNKTKNRLENGDN
jgi:hypothetical protein